MTRILRNVELRELVLDPTATPGPGCTSPAVVASDEVSRTVYVLVCRECQPPLPMPFTSAEERGKWASLHTKGTGHDLWLVRDEPMVRPPAGGG